MKELLDNRGITILIMHEAKSCLSGRGRRLTTDRPCMLPGIRSSPCLLKLGGDILIPTYRYTVFFVRSRVKSLIPRLPTTFSPNPPANPALPFGTCPKHPKHVATPSHTLSGPANQALGWLVRVVKSLCFCGVNVCMCRMYVS